MNNKKVSILNEKTYSFAIRIVRLSQYLQKEKNEYVLSKQILRSGTSIGALVRESEFGQSKADFVNKLSVALKEANETEFWILLLKDTDYIESRLAESLLSDCKEIIPLLISSIKTVKRALAEKNQ